MRVIAFLGGAVCLAGVARCDLINVQSTNRYVFASAVAGGGSTNPAYVFGPVAGPWSYSLTVPSYGPNGSYSYSTASQDSTIGGSAITGSYALNNIVSSFGGGGQASSHLSVQFRLDEPVTYGASASSNHTAPNLYDVFSYQLSWSGGMVFSVTPTMGAPFEGSGQLEPGVYTLNYRINMNGSNFNGVAQSDFHVAPVPSPGLLAMAGLGVLVLGRRASH